MATVINIIETGSINLCVLPNATLFSYQAKFSNLQTLVLAIQQIVRYQFYVKVQKLENTVGDRNSKHIPILDGQMCLAQVPFVRYLHCIHLLVATDKTFLTYFNGHCNLELLCACQLCKTLEKWQGVT